MKEQYTVYLIKGGTLQFECDFDFIDEAYDYVKARLDVLISTMRFTIIETLISIN